MNNTDVSMTHTVIKCLISFPKNNNIIKMNTCKRNNQDCLLCSDEYAKQEFLCKNEPLSGTWVKKSLGKPATPPDGLLA